MQVQISADRALKERKCTLEGQAQSVNVQGSARWMGVHRMGEWTLGEQNFFNWLLKLINQKQTKVKCLVRH